IFLLGRRLFNATAGIVAAMTYAVLSVSPSVLGLAAHATHFVILTVLAGVLLLHNRSRNHSLYRLFASGLFFGVSLLMKQPAAFFVVFALIYLLSRDIQCRFKVSRVLVRTLAFAAGVVLPFGIMCMVLWGSG